MLEAAAPYGLAGVSGSSSSVGVVGYSLGGGMGPLSRQFGFGADQVLAAEMVTADGEVRYVDASTEPDLFWAVRGARGNFGVITSLVIRLVPVATIYAGAVFFAGDSARDVLHSFRAWAPTLPDRTSTSVALLNFPPLEELPPMLRGQYVVMLRFAHNGDEAEGAELLAPMLEAGTVLLDGVAAMPYTSADAIHQDPTDPMPVWEKGALLRELTADVVEALLAVAGPGVAPPLAMVELRLMGGALGRQPSVPNAVSGREGAYSVLALGALAPGLEELVPTLGGAVLDTLDPRRTGTSLLNWLGATSGPAEVVGPGVPRSSSGFARSSAPSTRATCSGSGTGSAWTSEVPVKLRPDDLPSAGGRQDRGRHDGHRRSGVVGDRPAHSGRVRSPHSHRHPVERRRHGRHQAQARCG